MQPPIPPPDNRIRFDKTITLGNLISMGMFCMAIVVGWSSMDKRVLVLEEARTAQRERDATQDSTLKEGQQSVKEALADLRRSVEKLADRVGAR
jgi:hypothetical protein